MYNRQSEPRKNVKKQIGIDLQSSIPSFCTRSITVFSILPIGETELFLIQCRRNTSLMWRGGGGEESSKLAKVNCFWMSFRCPLFQLYLPFPPSLLQQNNPLFSPLPSHNFHNLIHKDNQSTL